MASEECWELLRAHSIGRVVVAAPSGPPLVLPVNYVLHGNGVLFRSDDRTATGVVGDRHVTFQVDHFDWYHRVGWSVLVHGPASEVGAPEGVTLVPWAGGDKARWILISAAGLSGRRIVLPDAEDDPHGYL